MVEIPAVLNPEQVLKEIGFDEQGQDHFALTLKTAIIENYISA